MPPGYSGLKYCTETIPNDKGICDYQKCNVNDAESEVQHLLCFHTFHTECLEHCNNRCPMCTEYLSETCDKLANQFNNSLLSSQEPEIILPEELEPDTSEDPCNQKITSDCDPEYYESDLWNKRVDTSLESFNVPQPRLLINVKYSQTVLLQTTTNKNFTTSCKNTNDQSSHLAKSSLLVQLTQHKFGNSYASAWFFPMDISQSTLFGRNGSNASTYISLYLSHNFHVNQRELPLSAANADSSLWAQLFILAIYKVNKQ